MNIYEKELRFKLVIYYSYTEMHGQQNIKKNSPVCLTNLTYPGTICAGLAASSSTEDKAGILDNIS